MCTNVSSLHQAQDIFQIFNFVIQGSNLFWQTFRKNSWSLGSGGPPELVAVNLRKQVCENCFCEELQGCLFPKGQKGPRQVRSIRTPYMYMGSVQHTCARFSNHTRLNWLSKPELLTPKPSSSRLWQEKNAQHSYMYCSHKDSQKDQIFFFFFCKLADSEKRRH